METTQINGTNVDLYEFFGLMMRPQDRRIYSLTDAAFVLAHSVESPLCGRLLRVIDVRRGSVRVAPMVSGQSDPDNIDYAEACWVFDDEVEACGFADVAGAAERNLADD